MQDGRKKLGNLQSVALGRPEERYGAVDAYVVTTLAGLVDFVEEAEELQLAEEIAVTGRTLSFQVQVHARCPQQDGLDQGHVVSAQ